MKDLNLFNHYKKRKDFSAVSYGRVVLPSCAAVMIVIFLGVYLVTASVTAKLNKEIDGMKKELTSPASIQKLQLFNETKNRVAVMTRYDSTIDSVESNIGRTSYINSDFLLKINGTIPQDVYIESMKIDGNTVQILGISKKRSSVAEYQYNLKMLNLFDDVFVGDISVLKNKDSTQSNLVRGYEFALQCKQKGGLGYAIK